MDFEQFFNDNFCGNEKCGATLPSPRSACPYCGSSNKEDNEDVHLSRIVIPIKGKNLKIQVSKAQQQGQEVDHKCPKCGHTKLVYQAQQTRSADEGQTVLYTCLKCSHKFSEN